MNAQEDFYDIPSSNRTPTETRAKLVDIALPIIGADKKDALTDLVAHKSTPNGGTAVTDELKYTSTFYPSPLPRKISLRLNSQVLPSKLDPRLPNRSLGRSRRW